MPGKTILIVDDDPVIVKYLETLFKNNGYDTTVAYNGLEAENCIKELVPDLITLDLEMPHEWGPRFYRKFIKNKLYKNIPVIVISGRGSRDHSIREAVGVFNKPFDPDKLMETVKKNI